VADRIAKRNAILGKPKYDGQYATLPLLREDHSKGHVAATETTPTEMTKTAFGGDVVEAPNRAKGFSQIAKNRVQNRGRTFYSEE
jgi:hypothetical protein